MSKQLNDSIWLPDHPDISITSSFIHNRVKPFINLHFNIFRVTATYKNYNSIQPAAKPSENKVAVLKCTSQK